MSKFATKAADSPFYLARMEASKVNDRLASREGAADETGIDRSRMARVELGSANPTPEEVLLLADTYDAPQLLKTGPGGRTDGGRACKIRKAAARRLLRGQQEIKMEEHT